MRSERVSVIIPVRNAARWLHEALGSIVRQTVPAEEILVIEDGSTDATVEIAEGFQGVRVVRSAPKGIAAAMNLGVRESKGDLIAFLAYDDWWESRKLELQIPFLAKHPESSACITKFRYFLEPGSSIPPGYNPALQGRDLVGRFPETLLARREAFLRVPGPFREDMRIGFDVDWFARLVEHGMPVVLLEEVLMHKRLHGTNESNNGQLGTQNLLRIFRESLARRRSKEGTP